MKYVSLIVIVLLLSSCSASWHIKKAIEKDPESFKSDTTITKIVFKTDTIITLDTIISIILPRDTVKIDSLVFRTIRPSFKKITKKNGIITTEVSMYKGVLKVNSFFDSSMVYNLRMKIRLKDAKIRELITINTRNEVTIKNQETKLKTFLNWIKWIGISLGVLIVLSVVYKLYKWIK